MKKFSLLIESVICELSGAVVTAVLGQFKILVVIDLVALISIHR